MSRSSPDLQHVVSLTASRVSKNPKVVKQIGHRLLDYLCQTANYCLLFGGRKEPDDEVNVFNTRERPLPICWCSSKQTLVSLSTAENELAQAVEGAILLKDVESVIRTLLSGSTTCLPCSC